MDNNMITCTACGHMISGEVAHCPNCGQITAYGKRLQQREEERREQERQAQQHKEMAKSHNITALVYAVAGVVGMIIAGHGLFTMLGDINDYRNGWGYNYQGHLTSHEQGVIIELIFGAAFWIVMMFMSRRTQKKANEEKQKSNYKPPTFSDITYNNPSPSETRTKTTDLNNNRKDPTKLVATVVPPDSVKKALLYVCENLSVFNNTTEIKEYLRNTLGTLDILEPSVVEMLDKRIKVERIYGSMKNDTKREIESYLASILSLSVQDAQESDEKDAAEKDAAEKDAAKDDDSWDDSWDQPEPEPKRVIDGEVYDALQYMIDHSEEFNSVSDMKSYLLKIGNIKEKTEPELRKLIDKRIKEEKNNGHMPDAIKNDLIGYLEGVTKEQR